MAKKKSETNGPPAAAAEPPPEIPLEPTPNHPLVSWRFPTDRSTQVEVTIWPNIILTKDGEEVEVVGITIKRTFHHEGTWKTGGAFRYHDLPVLIHALRKAWAWVTDGRDLNNPLNGE